MNTITAQQIVLTSIGPVALIDGTWHSVNGTSTEVYEVRYALRPSEVEALGLAPAAQIIDLTSTTIAPTAGAYHFVCLDTGADRISVDGVVHAPSAVLGSGSHLWVWHDGVRYHAADWSGDSDDVTPLVRTATPPAPPALAPIRIGQTVYWKNMFGITNAGRVEFVDELHVIVRLPDDEDTGTRGGALTLRRSQVSTSRPSR